MDRVKSWKCDVCGYIHSGDAPPETCPICGVGPEQFRPFEVAPASAPASTAAWRCTICDYVHEGDAAPAECPVCAAPASMFQPLQEQGEAATGASGGVGRILVLGAGIAGLTAAKRARRADDKVQITLLSKEPGLPYYRLSLTPLLAGQIQEEAMALQPEGWFAEQRIELLHGEAAQIRRGDKEVLLTDGRVLPYDSLVLANGSHPFIPPIPGATREGVMAVRTLADTREVMERAAAARACVCIGGGLLGLEIAGGLLQRGTRATVLEGFDYLLPRQLSRPASELLRRHLEGQGLTIRSGVKIKEIVGDEAVGGVMLESGEEIPADLVLVTTGVRPNSYLARQAELEVRHGVVVDDQMRTSDPDILAAGDVAEHAGRLYGLWSSAFAQGQVAGANAAGGAALFEALFPSTRLKVLDVNLFSLGTFEPLDGSYQLYERADERSYLRLVCRDGQVVGCNLFGDTSLASELSQAVEQRTQLSELGALLEQLPGLTERCGSV